MKVIYLASALSLTYGYGARAANFEAVTIDDDVKIGYGLALEDVNGDGKTDIVLVDKDQIRWYEAPGFEPHVITEQLTERDHVCIAVRDIDGDGKAEIAAGAGWNPGDTNDSGSVHYLVSPEDRSSLWSEIRLPNEPTTHRMRWIQRADGRYDLLVAPLHGRGNRAGRGAGVKIEAYRMPEDPNDDWARELVSGDWHVTHNVDPVAWDDRPGEEVLVSSYEGIFLCRFVDGEWRRRALVNAEVGHSEFQGASEIRLGRLKNGRRLLVSIEPFHGNQAVAYVANGTAPNGWKRHVLDAGLNGGHAVATGDLLGLGYDQVVVGWRAPDGNEKVGIKLFEPTDGDGTEWKTHWVDSNEMACEDLRLADMDGDGKLDIVASGRASNNLIIYYNR